MDMKKFSATKVDDTTIELSNSKDLENLFKTIEKEENFVLQWYEGSVLQSELMIGNHLSSKVKNGDLKITSKEAK